MNVLGIDPGSRKIGYALLEGDKNKIKLLNSGVLKVDHIEDFLLRIKKIFKLSNQLIHDFSPHEIAVESLIFKKNPLSLIKLAQARGAILSAFLQSYEGKIFEYPPNLVKATAAGYGHATKKSVEKSLTYFIGDKEYKTNDESDAVAVAICHLAHRQNSNIPLNNLKGRGNRSLSQSLKHLAK